MRKSSSSLLAPQSGGNVGPKNTERRVFALLDGKLKVTDEPRRSRGSFNCFKQGGSSSKGYNDALCFVSCIGQTRGAQTRIINQISEEVSYGTSSFPVRKALQTTGGLISTKKPSNVTLGTPDKKWETTLHCVDLNTTIDEEGMYSRFVEFCWHISSAIVIVVDDASYEKILYALRRIPEIAGRTITAAFVFLNWEAKDAVGRRFQCGSFMNSGDFKKLASTKDPRSSDALRAVAIAAMRFSKVIIGFSDTWAIDLKLTQILPYCEPMRWEGVTSQKGDMFIILQRVANVVNKRYTTGAHNRTVIELPIESNTSSNIAPAGSGIKNELPRREDAVKVHSVDVSSVSRPLSVNMTSVYNPIAPNAASAQKSSSPSLKSPQKPSSPPPNTSQPVSPSLLSSNQPVNSTDPSGQQLPSPLIPATPILNQQPARTVLKSNEQIMSPRVTSAPHYAQSPNTNPTPRPLNPATVAAQPTVQTARISWSSPPHVITQQRLPSPSPPPPTLSVGPVSSVTPPIDVVTWLRQYGVFSRVQVALCAEILSKNVPSNYMFELPQEVKQAKNGRNYNEAKAMYDLFLEDVKALRDIVQQVRNDLSEILKTAFLSDASLTAQAGKIQSRVQGVQFKFKPEEVQLKKILGAASDNLIEEFQSKCSSYFEGQVMQTKLEIDHAFGQYEALMKKATSTAYFSDEQFKKMHEHILDQLEPKLTSLRGFETRQEEVKDKFKKLYKQFKEENTRRVRGLERERERVIKDTLKNLRVLSEIFPGLDARLLTEAGWEIFTRGAKDPETAKLYAEEMAAAIRGEVKDITGNIDEGAVFCLEDFETGKGGIFIPKSLEEKLRNSTKSDGGVTNSEMVVPLDKEQELKKELEQLITQAKDLMEQGPPKGSVMEGYVSKRIEDATSIFNLSRVSAFKLRQAVEQLKIVIEKLE